ncbi:MAG: ABC transporter permease [Bacteroidia bacterium]|nr:ABC transporter permease [Bacteroidia bacterium]
MNKLIRFVITDVLKSKIIIGYTIFITCIAWGTFLLEDSPTKGIATLLNIVLLIVPLFSLVFSTIYIYNSSEFIELLLSQPIQRKTIWLSIFAGLMTCLVISLAVAIGLPLLLFVDIDLAIMIMVMAALVAGVFTALATLCSILSRDKAKGIGYAVMAWLLLAFFFDVLILFLLFQFADYPIEKPAVVLVSLNPIDLARILILLKLDISSMLGFTGAVFRSFFGNNLGMVMAILMLFLWIILPVWASTKIFGKKDL